MKLNVSLLIVGAFAGLLTILPLSAAEPATASEMAARLDAIGEGSTLIRTKMEVRGEGAPRVLQLEIKRRRTKSANDLAYRVFWPNERKGEAVFLHQGASGAPSGSVVTAAGEVRALKAAQMDEGLFESDLAYQDAIESFFAWKNQAIVGTEAVDGVECQILESKPDASSDSIYGKVRSWIDPRRLVPLRVEKYSPGGELIRRIDTTRVARDEQDHFIPGNLTAHGPRKGSVTELTGARIDQKVNFTDADFAPAKASN